MANLFHSKQEDSYFGQCIQTLDVAFKVLHWRIKMHRGSTSWLIFATAEQIISLKKKKNAQKKSYEIRQLYSLDLN